MCRFAAPLAFNFMAAVAIPPSSRHSEGDYDVQDTVSSLGICNSHGCHLHCQTCVTHMHVICVIKRVMTDSCQHALAAACCSIVHQLSASTAELELHNQVIPWCTGLIHSRCMLLFRPFALWPMVIAPGCHLRNILPSF